MESGKKEYQRNDNAGKMELKYLYIILLILNKILFNKVFSNSFLKQLSKINFN